MVTERLSSLIQKFLNNFFKHFYLVQHWLWYRKHVKRGLSLGVFFIYLLFGPELLFAHNPSQKEKEEEKRSRSKLQLTLTFDHLQMLNTMIDQTDHKIQSNVLKAEQSLSELEKILDEVEEREEENGPLDQDDVECAINDVDECVNCYENSSEIVRTNLEKAAMLQTHKLLLLKNSKESFQQKTFNLQSQSELDSSGRPAPSPAAAGPITQRLTQLHEHIQGVKRARLKISNERDRQEDRDEKHENEFMPRVCALEQKLDAYGTPCSSSSSTPCASPLPSPSPSPIPPCFFSELKSRLEEVFTSGDSSPLGGDSSDKSNDHEEEKSALTSAPSTPCTPSTPASLPPLESSESDSGTTGENSPDPPSSPPSSPRAAREKRSRISSSSSDSSEKSKNNNGQREDKGDNRDDKEDKKDKDDKDRTGRRPLSKRTRFGSSYSQGGSGVSFIPGYSRGSQTSSLQGLQCVLLTAVEQIAENLRFVTLKATSRLPKVGKSQLRAETDNTTGSKRKTASRKATTYWKKSGMSLGTVNTHSVNRLWSLFSGCRVFAVMDSHVSNLEYKVRSGYAGVLTNPVSDLHIGLTYNRNKHKTKEYHGMLLGSVTGSAKSKMDIDGLSATVAWNTDKGGFTGNLTSYYGWGQLKNIRYCLHAEQDVTSKGTPHVSMSGGLIQLGYNVCFSKTLMFTPYVEYMFVSARWSPYDEYSGMLPCTISGNRRQRTGKSIGLRNCWDITDSSQVQTWFAASLGNRKTNDVTSQPLQSSELCYRAFVPGYTKKYMQGEAGIVYEARITDSFKIRLNGNVCVEKTKGYGNIQCLFHIGL